MNLRIRWTMAVSSVRIYLALCLTLLSQATRGAPTVADTLGAKRGIVIEPADYETFLDALYSTEDPGVTAVTKVQMLPATPKKSDCIRLGGSSARPYFKRVGTGKCTVTGMGRPLFQKHGPVKRRMIRCAEHCYWQRNCKQMYWHKNSTLCWLHPPCDDAGHFSYILETGQGSPRCRVDPTACFTRIPGYCTATILTGLVATSVDLQDCAARCLRSAACRSFRYKEETRSCFPMLHKCDYVEYEVHKKHTYQRNTTALPIFCKK